MELFELEKEKKIKEAKKNSIRQKIALQKCRLEPGAADYSKLVVDSSKKDGVQIDVISTIVEMEKDLDFIDKELDILNENVDILYKIFKEYNDEEQQIYIEKKLKKWSNAKISVHHHGISKSQINKIVKKIKNSQK